MARFAVLLTAAANVFTVFGCKYDRIAKCTQPVRHELSDERLSLAANLEDLKLYCDRMERAHRCIEIEIDVCPRQLKDSYRRAMNAEKFVMEDVCKSGDAQKEYLKYAPCFRAMLMEGGSCHVAYSHLMDVTVALNPSQPSGDVNPELNQVLHRHVIANVCCAYHALHACYMANTARDCGAEALQTSLRSLDKLNGGMEQSCSTVKPSCAGYVVTSAASPLGGESILRAIVKAVQGVGTLILRI
ncbi:uncharacterized protein LOC100907696 [Galendromus occidentalis]|uniref:Uncharacterized protein LOC100907696 n=1 Tax=Galendromus occidentalis TaxID=34638 RepID=A0AAJ6QNR3_9ACAR|nr:uncharacterized protein LOC100907696 [Galendromus occidentalis]